jgi:uncharacterized C2H2 Zn-finger protein
MSEHLPKAPALNVRCLHIDLKGMTPTFEYLLEIIRKLADLKINSILLEYEDKIQFESHPYISHPTMAFRREQVRELVEVCRSLGIDIIPKLQCYGHWDYILKHPEYHDLRGGGGASSYQICPSVERSFEVWRDMMDELLELHGDSEYVHIGADEADLTLACPLCNDQNRFNLYIKHVERCVDYLRERGKKVLIWDDVFRKHEIGDCNDLIKKAIPVVWQYRDINEEFITRLLEHGAEVWGASGIQITDLRYAGIMPAKKRLKNINDWAQLNNKYGLSSHIATLWTRAQCQTPPEGFLPGNFFSIALWAETVLHGEPVSIEEFSRCFPERFFGANAPELAEMSTFFGVEPSTVKDMLALWLGKVSKNSDVLDIIYVLNKLDCVLEYADYCFKSDMALYPAYLNSQTAVKINKNYLDGVRIVRERIAEVSSEMDEILGKYMQKDMLEEFKRSRFAAVEMINDLWERIIGESSSV